MEDDNPSQSVHQKCKLYCESTESTLIRDNMCFSLRPSIIECLFHISKYFFCNCVSILTRPICVIQYERCTKALEGRFRS